MKIYAIYLYNVDFLNLCNLLCLEEQRNGGPEAWILVPVPSLDALPAWPLRAPVTSSLNGDNNTLLRIVER